jgi:hypothetical protein
MEQRFQVSRYFFGHERKQYITLLYRQQRCRGSETSEVQHWSYFEVVPDSKVDGACFCHENRLTTATVTN